MDIITLYPFPVTYTEMLMVDIPLRDDVHKKMMEFCRNNGLNHVAFVRDLIQVAITPPRNESAHNPSDDYIGDAHA
jgi:hypothetical protein